MTRKQTMQRCSIWTVSLAAALSLTGAAWAEHEGGGGHGPAGRHGTTPTFAKHRESDEARESHSGAQNSGTHSAAGVNFVARLTARMANDPTLAAEVNSLVMPTGMSVQAAAMGFRNLDQFLTALHPAKDLGIDFKTLQTDMTGPGHDSLAQAILDQSKTSTLDATTLKADVTKARQEAKADLKADRAAKDKAEDAKEAAEEANEGAKAGANFVARLTARMANDPTLAAEVNSLVMPTGMSVQDAAKGFRNLNQFLTALNAAKDLGIDFKTLQTDMTGPGHDSLAQAILDQPKTSTLDAATLKADIMKARNEAKADLQAVRAAEDKAEDAKEAANEAAEDAKEATKEAAEEAKEAANEAAKTPTSGGTTGSTTAGSQPRP
jgi:hypothetical protein